MNTERENWIEKHPEEYEFFESIKWIKEKFPKVYDKFLKDMEEHISSCKHDEYYRYSCGTGKVPVPRCEYCNEYDGDRCHIRWNNNDDCYYNPDLDDKEPDDLCEGYDWNNELEDIT